MSSNDVLKVKPEKFLSKAQLEQAETNGRCLKSYQKLKMAGVKIPVKHLLYPVSVLDGCLKLREVRGPRLREAVNKLVSEKDMTSTEFSKSLGFNSSLLSQASVGGFSAKAYQRISKKLGKDMWELVTPHIKKRKAGKNLPLMSSRKIKDPQTIGKEVARNMLGVSESRAEALARREGFELCLKLWRNKAPWDKVEEERERLQVDG